MGGGGCLTFSPPVLLSPLADTESKQRSKDHEEEASCAGAHDDIEMQTFFCKRRRWLREGLEQRGPFVAPASYDRQMKGFQGTFHLTEAELPEPGVVCESARAEDRGQPTSAILPLRRASKF